jgi:hypothetical protein
MLIRSSSRSSFKPEKDTSNHNEMDFWIGNRDFARRMRAPDEGSGRGSREGISDSRAIEIAVDAAMNRRVSALARKK